MPASERGGPAGHIVILGAMGSGKTSLLLRLIEDDLAAGRGLCVIAPEAELFRDWLLPFEIVSIVLLVALIGAVVIAHHEEEA